MRSICITLMLTLVVSIATAQTKVQRGIVRKQTFYPNDKTVPVQGVYFLVTGATDVSATCSDADGKFSLNVKDNKNHQFSFAAVRPNNYELLSPKIGEAIGLHFNDKIYVVVYTPEDKAAFIKKIRDEQKRKNTEQMLQIQKLRDERDKALLLLSESDAHYETIKAEYDSLQNLLDNYKNNRKKIDKMVDEISEELALVDYQSLDSVDRRIYELKCTGNGKKVTDFINDLMKGSPEASWKTLQEEKQNIQKEKLRLASKEQKNDIKMVKWFSYMKDLIEGLRMQHLNDSASHYFALLIKADSTNWEYYNMAGTFELKYHLEHIKALQYFKKSILYANSDTLKFISYNNIGLTFSYLKSHKLALKYYEKAIALMKKKNGMNKITIYNNVGSSLLENGNYTDALIYFNKAIECVNNCEEETTMPIVATYNNIAVAYYRKGEFNLAIDFYKKSLGILSTLQTEEKNSDIAVLYTNIGNILYKKSEFTAALEYYKNASQINHSVYEDNFITAYTDAIIGRLYTRNKDYKSAIDYLISASKIFKRYVHKL